MGRALLCGSIRGGLDPAHVRLGVRHPDQVRDLADELGVDVHESMAAAADGVDVVVVALPAAPIPSVLHEIAGALAPGALVVSIADGLTLAELESHVPDGVGLVRAMPSLTAWVNAGSALMSTAPSCSDEQRETAEALLRLSSSVLQVDEEEIAAMAPLSSGGPAHLLYVADAMIEAGAIRGVPRDAGRKLLAEALAGAAALLAETSTDPSELRAQFCAPGGAGARRIARLDEHRVRGSFLSALGGDI